MYSKKLAQSIHFIQAGYALCDSPEGGVKVCSGIEQNQSGETQA